MVVSKLLPEKEVNELAELNNANRFQSIWCSAGSWCRKLPCSNMHFMIAAIVFIRIAKEKKHRVWRPNMKTCCFWSLVHQTKCIRVRRTSGMKQGSDGVSRTKIRAV